MIDCWIISSLIEHWFDWTIMWSKPPISGSFASISFWFDTDQFEVASTVFKWFNKQDKHSLKTISIDVFSHWFENSRPPGNFTFIEKMNPHPVQWETNYNQWRHCFIHYNFRTVFYVSCLFKSLLRRASNCFLPSLSQCLWDDQKKNIFHWRW